MKIYKLNQYGVAHYLVPAMVMLLVAVVGVRVITNSHAQTPPTNFVTNTANTGTSTNVAVLGAQNAQSGADSAMSSVPYSFIGSQTVDFLAPGQTLAYNNGLKGNEVSCYLVYVDQPKSGTATATVEFANNNNTLTTNLSSTTSNNLQQVCVNPGRGSNPGFEVKNLTSTQQNTNIEVYEDIIRT